MNIVTSQIALIFFSHNSLLQVPFHCICFRLKKNIFTAKFLRVLYAKMILPRIHSLANNNIPIFNSMSAQQCL